ncbi:hypothetical protein [Pseudooceanicola sp.]|uniref:hypothetical protein n=1 Tax=Pseudooceanicola sp. TaxID=1914328 RepID=UPI004057FE06
MTLTMTRLGKITLSAATALTLASAAQAQSDITRETPKLTAPTGYPFISVITLDRDTGGLQLCGRTQWSGEPPTCEPLPAQSDTDKDAPVTPKRQSLWDL